MTILGVGLCRPKGLLHPGIRALRFHRSELSVHPGSLAVAVVALAGLRGIRSNVVSVLVEVNFAVVLAHINFEFAGGAAALPAARRIAPSGQQRLPGWLSGHSHAIG